MVVGGGGAVVGGAAAVSVAVKGNNKDARSGADMVVCMLPASAPWILGASACLHGSFGAQ